MLPIVDKPVIQYLVEEAVSAGITDIIIVTGRGKRSIEDHFDVSYELEKTLVEKGKTKELAEVEKVSNLLELLMSVSRSLVVMVMHFSVLGNLSEMSHVSCSSEMISSEAISHEQVSLSKRMRKKELRLLLLSELLINVSLPMVLSNLHLTKGRPMLSQNFSKSQNQKRHHQDSVLSESMS